MSGARVYKPRDGGSGPDPKVLKLENDTQASIGIQNLSIDNGRNSFPQRPAFGTHGDPVVVLANYFELEVKNPDLKLGLFSISVQPAATGRKLMRIVELLLSSSSFERVRKDVVTDYKTFLVSTQKPPQNQMTFKVSYRAENEDEVEEGSSAPRPQYSITLDLQHKLAVGDLLEYLRSSDPNANYEGKLVMVQALNIFLNHYVRERQRTGKLDMSGMNKIFSRDPRCESRDLGFGLRALRGLFTSVRPATGRILINLNVAHSPFYKEGPLPAVIREFGIVNKYRLEPFLKLLNVSLKHLPPKFNKAGTEIVRKRTIIGLASRHDGRRPGHVMKNPPIGSSKDKMISFGAGPKDILFWLESSDEPSRYITVYEYFLKTYNRNVDPNFPVLNVGSVDDPTYLPADVCHVVPGQAARAQLNPTQMQNMLRLAVRRSFENINTIATQGIPTAGLAGQNSRMEQANLRINPEPVRVAARVLPNPQVRYSDNRSVSMQPGSWNLMGKKFVNTGTIEKWSCILVSQPDLYQDRYRDATDPKLTETLTMLRKVLNQTGIATDWPCSVNKVEIKEGESPLRLELQKAAEQKLDMVFVILPDGNTRIYDRIKFLGDIELGVLTICSNAQVLSKNQDQYLRNIAMKFNLKAGGNNHLVEPARLGFLSEGRTMVVGIDVTHPPPNCREGAPSVAGIVASVDAALGQWPGALSAQPSRQEMVDALRPLLKSRLELWRARQSNKGTLPDKILVYRDGVSEGQYSMVRDQEVPQLLQACKEIYSSVQQKKPQLTVVVCGKRHHTRFYPAAADKADRNGNTNPGTCVDRSVTEARNWDFYLQPHFAIQGTPRPCHYFVVYDEIIRSLSGANKADILENVTLGLCYTFGRATRAVSLCTPAYYADKLCDRARCYLKDEAEAYGSDMASVASGSTISGKSVKDRVRVHPNLQRKMFYI